MIKIQDLEKFFNNKNERNQDFHSPNTNSTNFEERTKNLSNNLNDKDRGKIRMLHPNKNLMPGTITKNRPPITEGWYC